MKESGIFLASITRKVACLHDLGHMAFLFISD